PNSLYVGLIRIKALGSIKELRSRAPQAVMSDIKGSWFEALNLSSTERADFENALKKLNEKVRTSLTEKDPNGRQAAALEANKVYEEEIAAVVKQRGNPQAGWKLTGAMTVINVLCLLAVWESTPEFKNFSARNAMDITLAGTSVAAGVCTT